MTAFVRQAAHVWEWRERERERERERANRP